MPGSVWYAVGRGVLLHRRGIGRRALAVTAGLEAALSAVTGLGLGVALLLAVGRLPGGLGLLAVWCVLLVAAVSPSVVNLGLRLIARRTGGTAQQISWRRFVGLAGWMAAFWLGAAGMFALYLQAFPQAAAAPVEAAGAFMVAWVVGYFAVFAPQGLGVFVVAVAAILFGAPGAALVLVIAGYRAVTLVRDLAAVAVAEVTRRRW
jgi:glycosyltransferase 2 family protein